MEADRMKTTLCKLSPKPETVLEMPLGATILSIQVKDGYPHLLILENPDELKTERRYFWTSEVGNRLPTTKKGSIKHVGTFMLEEVTSRETWDDIVGTPGPELRRVERFFCVFEGQK